MARKQGTLKLSSNLEPRVSAPLDAREKVANLSDLTNNGTFPYPYEGMEVYVESEKKRYTLIGQDPTVSSNWYENGGDKTSILFIDELPEVGDIENVIYALYSPICTDINMTCDYRIIEDIEGFVHDEDKQEFTVANGYRITTTGVYTYDPPKYIYLIKYTGTGTEYGDSYTIRMKNDTDPESHITAVFNNKIPIQVQKVHYEYYVGCERDQTLEKLLRSKDLKLWTLFFHNPQLIH